MSEVGKGDGEGATINLPLPGEHLSPSCMLLLCCHIASGTPRQLLLHLSAYTSGGMRSVPPVLPPSACADHTYSLLRTYCSDTCCTGDSGSAAMSAAFEEVVAPAAERFRPDILLVRSLLCGWAFLRKQQHNLPSAEYRELPLTFCGRRCQQATMHIGEIPWRGCSSRQPHTTV